MVSQKMLTVCLITYNHQPYVKKALESILVQKTSFEWDILIADDCSSDGTTDILTEYKSRFNDKIQLQVNKINLGPSETFLNLIYTPKTKYIAYLEGDDYWTDDTKLQQQFDWLEASELAACYHYVSSVDQQESIIEEIYNPINKDLFSFSDIILKYHSIHCTSSIMFESKLISNPPDWFLEHPTDFFLDLVLTREGNQLGCLKSNLGAYRIHSSGIWQGLAVYKRVIEDIRRFHILLKDSTINQQYGEFIRKAIASRCIEIGGKTNLKFFQKVEISKEFIKVSSLSFRSMKALIKDIILR